MSPIRFPASAVTATPPEMVRVKRASDGPSERSTWAKRLPAFRRPAQAMMAPSSVEPSVASISS